MMFLVFCRKNRAESFVSWYQSCRRSWSSSPSSSTLRPSEGQWRPEHSFPRVLQRRLAFRFVCRRKWPILGHLTLSDQDFGRETAHKTPCVGLLHETDFSRTKSRSFQAEQTLWKFFSFFFFSFFFYFQCMSRFLELKLCILVKLDCFEPHDASNCKYCTATRCALRAAILDGDGGDVESDNCRVWLSINFISNSSGVKWTHCTVQIDLYRQSTRNSHTSEEHVRRV